MAKALPTNDAGAAVLAPPVDPPGRLLMETDPCSFRECKGTVAVLPDIIRHILERKELFIKFGYKMDRARDAAPACRAVALTSFDISEDESKAAKSYPEFYGLEKFADFRVENGERLSFPDGSFSKIFSVNLVHPLPVPCKAFDELGRVLKPKGELSISDFTEEGFRTMDRIHAWGGGVHDRGVIAPSQAADYLTKQGIKLKTTHVSRFRQTCISGKWR
jgi:SAM-dependent methyltransferase